MGEVTSMRSPILQGEGQLLRAKLEGAGGGGGGPPRDWFLANVDTLASLVIWKVPPLFKAFQFQN